MIELTLSWEGCQSSDEVGMELGFIVSAEPVQRLQEVVVHSAVTNGVHRVQVTAKLVRCKMRWDEMR